MRPLSRGLALIATASLGLDTAGAAPPPPEPLPRQRVLIGVGGGTLLHLQHPGARVHGDTLRQYGYSPPGPTLKARFLAAVRVWEQLDAGVSGTLGGTPDRTAQAWFRDLGAFVRAGFPVKSRLEIGLRRGGGVVFPGLELAQRELPSRAAGFARVGLDVLARFTEPLALWADVDYTLVDWGTAFDPWVGHPVGGLGLTIGAALTL